MKKAFTMIELIFVVVILGVLAAVAVPKLFVNRQDAELTVLKNELALIRTGIDSYHQEKSLEGKNEYPMAADVEKKLSENKKWKKFTYEVNSHLNIEFIYDDKNGTFKCKDESICLKYSLN